MGCSIRLISTGPKGTPVGTKIRQLLLRIFFSPSTQTVISPAKLNGSSGAAPTRLITWLFSLTRVPSTICQAGCPEPGTIYRKKVLKTILIYFQDTSILKTSIRDNSISMFNRTFYSNSSNFPVILYICIIYKVLSIWGQVHPANHLPPC